MPREYSMVGRLLTLASHCPTDRPSVEARKDIPCLARTPEAPLNLLHLKSSAPNPSYMMSPVSNLLPMAVLLHHDSLLSQIEPYTSVLFGLLGEVAMHLAEFNARFQAMVLCQAAPSLQ